MDLNEFAIDTELYEDGKKIELGKGTYIRVRASGSERAQKVRERLWKPYASWTEVPPEILSDINSMWVAQGLLVEMVGFTIDGEELKVDLTDREDQMKLARILAKPEFKAFRTKVLGVAIDDANFQAQSDEVLEKNSEPSPAGSSPGGEGQNNSDERTTKTAKASPKT